MLKILLLEDEAIISLSTKQTIEANCNVHVLSAYCAAEAQKIAHENRIDLLIADINLREDTDGIEVATQLNSLYHVPTLFLTSYSDGDILHRASEVDFIGYLVKPFREEELIAQIKLANFQFMKNEPLVTDLGNGYRYQYKTRELLKDGKEIILTAKEHQLLLLLINGEGKTVTFDYIDDLIWPARTVTSGARRQLFYRLRSKLPELDLQTVYHFGYVLKIQKQPESKTPTE